MLSEALGSFVAHAASCLATHSTNPGFELVERIGGNEHGKSDECNPR